MINKPRQGVLAVSLASCAALASTGVLHAQSTTELTARQSVTVDSNQDLEPNSPGATFISRTGLDAVVKGGNSVIGWLFGAGADLSLAAGEGEGGELNDINPRANVGVTVQRGTATLTGGAFIRRRPVSFARADEDNSVIVSPDDLPPVIGGELPPGLSEITSANADQLDFGANTSLNFAVDQKTRLTFGLSSNAKRFTGTSGALAGELIESETFSARAVFERSIDSRSTASITTNVTLFNTDNGSTDSSRSFGLSGGYSTRVTPRHSLNLGAGVSLIDSTLNPALSGGQTSDTSLSFTGNLGLRYQLIDSAYSIAVSQAVEPSALGELQNRTSVNVGATYQVNQRVSMSANAGLTLQNAISSSISGTDRQLANVGLNLNYQPTNDWNLGVAYRLQVSDQEGEGTATSHSATMTLSRSLRFLN